MLRAIHNNPTLHHLAGDDAINNHSLHRYLPGRSRDAEELAPMSAVPRKAATYLVFFSHHLLNHPVDVRKRSAECDNHLLKAFAPLLLAGERIEFNKIKVHEIVHPIDLTLINDFLNETEDRRFVLKSSFLVQLALLDFDRHQNRGFDSRPRLSPMESSDLAAK
jgi:hypothetical protein